VLSKFLSGKTVSRAFSATVGSSIREQTQI